MPYEHYFFIPLADGVGIRVNQSGRPIERDSVVLLIWHDGAWQEARVLDNHLGSHHMHRYTRSGGKQPPEEFHPGPTNVAVGAAIAHLKATYRSVILSWDK